MNDIDLSLIETFPKEDSPQIGWVCTYTPEEIILAAGFQPRRVLGDGQPVQNADAYLNNNLCPFVRGIFDQALQGTFDHLTGMVFVNSCDAMRRLHDVWRYYAPTPYVYILDLPRLVTPSSVEYYAAQLRRFIVSLEEKFDLVIHDQSLRQGITVMNETRHLFTQLYQLRRGQNSTLPGSQALTLSLLSVRSPKDRFNHWLREQLPQMKERTIQSNGLPRLLLSGSIIDQVPIVELVERCGAVVVAEEMCTGNRYFEGLVPEEGDPLIAIARRYLERAPCSRMKDVDRRVTYLLHLVEEYNVDGVIYYTIKFCDQYQYDLPLVREALRREEIPMLYLEGDYTVGSFGQLKTRVQAFVEVVGGRLASP